MSEQLELFTDGPFSLRVSIEDALRVFWDTYWRHLPSANTTKAHFRRLRAFFKGHYLDSISKADVERFRRFMKDTGYSDPTINKAHMVLSRVYSKFYEYKEGRFVNGQDFSRIILPLKNPAAQVPKVNERKFARKTVIGKDDLKILVSYADEDLKDILNALFWTGLRPSDLRCVTSYNVNLKKMLIEGIQSKTVTTKNPSGVPYRVHLTWESAKLVARRMETVKPGTPLFNFKNIQKRWQKTRAFAGMPWLQLRDIRRSAATYLLDNGVDPQTVAELLGHTTLRMLPAYTPRSEKHLIEAREKLVEV